MAIETDRAAAPACGAERSAGSRCGAAEAAPHRRILDGYRLFDIDLYRLRSPRFHADMMADRRRLLAALGDCVRAEAAFVCPLCGGREKTLFLRYEDYPLYRCATCSVVAANVDGGRLAAAGLADREITREDLKREILATFKYRKQTFAAERVAYLRETVPGFGGPETAVLDVGCGPGYFLEYLKEAGICGRGLEVSEACVAVCRERGLDVESGALGDEPDGAYTVVTLFDVLEHVGEPVAFMRTVRRKLRAGGYVLAFMPNLHSLAIYLMGAEHNMISPFHHRCFYDRRSLAFLADRSGFEIVRVETYGLDVMDYLAMKEAKDGYRYFEHLREMVGPIQAVIDAAGLGNSLRVLFRAGRAIGEPR